MNPEIELLDKIRELYEKRYSGKELEEKFNLACEDLIETNDLSRSVYIKYCIKHDIEPVVRTRTTLSSSYGNDPCGSGRSRSYMRSSC